MPFKEVIFPFRISLVLSSLVLVLVEELVATVELVEVGARVPVLRMARRAAMVGRVAMAALVVLASLEVDFLFRTKG
jgi:hypothetical protein